MRKKMTTCEPGFIAAISEVIAQTASPGLTGSELRGALRRCGNFELESGDNKRNSLEKTLLNLQVKQDAGDIVSRFITEAMNPSLFIQPDQQDRWKKLQAQLNAAMAMYSFKITDSGKVRSLTKPAQSLDEIAKLTSSLKYELERRNCHPNLFQYCNEELINESLFHAMSEAAKSILDRIRSLTGLTQDGTELIQNAFAAKNQDPLILINSFKDTSDKSEHTGFMNLLIGIYGHFRNP